LLLEIFTNADLKIIILFEILVNGILILILPILIPKQSKPTDTKTEEYPTSWEKSEKFKNFLTAKNFLISHYHNIASAQGVRIVGFTAGVFTLIGATQIKSDQALHNIIPAITFDTSSLFFSSLKLLFLSVSIFSLLFFVFRAIFRYATYANLADYLITVSLGKTENASGKTLHHQITTALIQHVEQFPRRVFGMPIWYFWSVSQYQEKTWYGVIVCTILSMSVTFLLLLLIW
jgi:hypothetical protein